MNDTDYAEIFKLCVKHSMFCEEVERAAADMAARVDFDISPEEATMTTLLRILGQRNAT